MVQRGLDVPGAGRMRTVVMGGSGRMGRMLCDLLLVSEQAQLVAVTEAPGHRWTGLDLGVARGGPANRIPVTEDFAAALDGAEAVIDFTTPEATVAMAKACAEAGAVHVIGTTGLSDYDAWLIGEASARATIVRAGNMSLGVNLLTQLVRQVAAALDDDYDIEIIEAHHRHKVDAPSGTAIMLGEAAAQGRGIALDAMTEKGRDGLVGARGKGAIGFHSIRGGDMVGEHDVIFASEGERIVLRHVATERSIFARGAVKAALWGRGRGPGAFDMLDVLGLRRT